MCNAQQRGRNQGQGERRRLGNKPRIRIVEIVAQHANPLTSAVETNVAIPASSDRQVDDAAWRRGDIEIHLQLISRAEVINGGLNST